METRFARIGRSYPRPAPQAGQPAMRSRRRYRVGALIALLSALGVIGWLLAR
jgi:hypothetical protein